MDAAIKNKWIDALVSGEYEQAEEYLRLETGFCCLGVLCDIVKEEVHGHWEFENGYMKWNDETGEAFSVLPVSVVDFAGLHSDNPSFTFDTGRSRPTLLSLAELNDAGMSFGEIAAIIDERL